MFRHSLRLIWNRRRANRLVVVEIAAAFVVTFVLLSLCVNLWTNFRRPLGFEYENIWSVTVTDESAGPPFGLGPGAEPPLRTDALDDILDALATLPRTEMVAPLNMTPFVNGQWVAPYGPDADNTVTTRVNRTTAEALQALGVTLVDGRWFGPEDEGQDYRAALINRTLVDRAFPPDQSPLGMRINHPPPDFPFDQYLERLSETQAREMLREIRVVGVIEDFRQLGEFSDPSPYVINRQEPGDATGSSFGLALKVAAGTDASFEEEIVATVASVAPGWTASITPWEQLRETRIDQTLLPFKAAGTVAAFFLALVVMGLIGVLWQDVVRRTQEIGLRRALGASAGAVRRQIQLEMLAVGAFGILIGTVVAIQFPLLELIRQIDWASAVPGIALSAALILTLVALGALYPSLLASRREPADALRYE